MALFTKRSASFTKRSALFTKRSALFTKRSALFTKRSALFTKRSLFVHFFFSLFLLKSSDQRLKSFCSAMPTPCVVREVRVKYRSVVSL